MKKASNVFSVIGMILNTVLAIIYSCGGYDGLVIAVEWVVAIIGIIVGISLIASNEKRIGRDCCNLLCKSIVWNFLSLLEW